ncbi:uncharacterized protein LOC135476730 [Liolophura sinensis]|uniref:uncharacterized protein LOC135476730 n=1 Tax=Liolophura sinensis TaxID=3198878 RepID=UPI00315958B3
MKREQVVAIGLLLLIFSSSILGYPDCRYPDFRSTGYTYTVDRNTPAKTWSFCNFPNPKYDHALCGMPEIDGYHYLCDPENLLSQTDALSVDNALKTLVNDTNINALCVNNNAQAERVVMTVILIDNIRVPDLSTDMTCVNDCGEVQPTLNVSQRSARMEEIDAAVVTFADGVRSHLNLGHCENDVVVVYSQRYHRIYTSIGYAVGTLIHPDVVSELNVKFIEDSLSGNNSFTAAMVRLVGAYRSQFRPALTPAQILLLLTLLLAGALAGVLMAAAYVSPNMKTVDIDVWGENTTCRVFRITLYIFTGVWILHLIVYIVYYIEQYAPLWVTLILALVFLVSIIVLHVFMGA